MLCYSIHEREGRCQHAGRFRIESAGRTRYFHVFARNIMGRVSMKSPAIRQYAAMAALLLVASFVTAEPVKIDGVAALVNESTVTMGDALALLQPVQQDLRARYRGKELEDKLREAYAEAVDRLVERQLILDSYESQDRKLPDWVVSRRIDEIVRNMFKGDRSKLVEALAEDGLTFDEWEEEVRGHVVVG